MVSRSSNVPAPASRPQSSRQAKMPRQSVTASRAPPMTGASMGARMVMVWIQVMTFSMARPRSTSLTMARAMALMPPLPMACTARQNSRGQMDWARARNRLETT